MVVAATRRGAPLRAAGVLLAAWIAVRALSHAGLPLPAEVRPGARAAFLPTPVTLHAAAVRGPTHTRPATRRSAALHPPLPLWAGLPPHAPTGPVRHDGKWAARCASCAARPAAPDGAAGPQAWAVVTPAGGMALGFPPVSASLPAAPLPVPVPVPMRAARARGTPWSADGWVLVRSSGGSADPARAVPARAVLGGSQAGLVVRHALSRSAVVQSAVYARVSRSFGAARESGAAAGVQISLAAPVPMTVHAELRVTDREQGTDVSPALFVSGGVHDRALGAGVTLRAFGQAGYAGGEHATAFVDGQTVVEREVVATGKANLRLGAGVWGGAQRGAERFEAGPQVALDLPAGRGRVRVEASYRLRLAGEAQPSGGPVLSLAAGF